MWVARRSTCSTPYGFTPFVAAPKRFWKFDGGFHATKSLGFDKTGEGLATYENGLYCVVAIVRCIVCCDVCLAPLSSDHLMDIVRVCRVCQSSEMSRSMMRSKQTDGHIACTAYGPVFRSHHIMHSTDACHMQNARTPSLSIRHH